jgi:hypothetical protein
MWYNLDIMSSGDRDRRPEEISLQKARAMIGLSRRAFRRYAEPYRENGRKTLEPLSVLHIADAAYQAGASKRFFPSLENVVDQVMEHVMTHTPEALPDTLPAVSNFLATATSLETGQTADALPTPPVATLQELERAYLGASNGF